MKIRPRRWRR